LIEKDENDTSSIIDPKEHFLLMMKMMIGKFGLKVVMSLNI